MTDILLPSRMAKRADAIIIGAGVIGAAVAFELAKRGYKTLNVDRLPASGYGPTSNSCAIVRAHYSSREGVAMAYEGFFYWKDWARYLGVVDDAGTARYMNCGTVLLKSATGHHEKVQALPRPRRGVRGMGQQDARGEDPCLLHRRVLAAQAPRRPALLGRGRGRARRRDLHPGVGLRERSAALDPQPAARRRSEGRRVHLPQGGGRDPARERQ